MSDPDAQDDPLDLTAMLAEANARQQRLLDRLEKSDLVSVWGVVHAGGPSGMSDGGDSEWSLGFTLQPWRTANGALQSTELYVRKGVSPEELRTLMNAFSAFAVVHLKARVSPECAGEDTWDTPQGLLVEVITTAGDDAELQQIARDLQIPRFFHDDYFGKLELDRRFNQLKGTRRRLFSKYEICIERVGETYDARAAWDTLRSIENRSQAIRDAISDHLFDTYDSAWESLGKLSRASFQKKAKLYLVNISADGSASVWFHDGGLFLGHEIEVRIDKDGTITSADIVG